MQSFLSFFMSNEPVAQVVRAVTVIIIVLGVLLGWDRMKKAPANAKNNPSKMKKKLAGLAKGFARKTEGKSLSNVVLKVGDEDLSPDAVVVAPFGVMILLGCDEAGNIYLEEKDPEIAKEQGNKKSFINNPYLRIEKTRRAVNELLRKEGIAGTDTACKLIFTNRYATVIAPRSMQRYNMKSIREEFKKAEYQKDNNFAVEKAADALLKMTGGADEK